LIMRCIFCGNDSSSSRSVEHIIPASFGNSISILPKGIVCDKCNNYFARKIEAPFLNSEAVLQLRQELEIHNRNGKVVNRFADLPSENIMQISQDLHLVMSHEDKTEEKVEQAVLKYQKYLKRTDELLIKPDYNLSRLLAKMAVEAFAYKCLDDMNVIDYIIEDAAFKKIREYVRYGGNYIWEYSARRIYARNEAYHSDVTTHINYEFDFLFTSQGKAYFIIVMYGIEYVINIIDNTILDYAEWLKANHYISSLYITHEQRKKEFEGYANFFAK